MTAYTPWPYASAAPTSDAMSTFLATLTAERDSLRAQQAQWTAAHGSNNRIATVARIKANALDDVLATAAAQIAAPAATTPDVAAAADRLRTLADHRAEYIRDPTDPIALEVATARHLAKILDGDLAAESGWLPSWRWTAPITAWLDDKLDNAA